jgi:thymidylate synthase (FAD)
MMEYRNLLSAGICEEQARSVLPLSMMTKWWWSGSLDAFADMCRLRCAPDAQEESRILAMQISVEMVKRYPVSWAALRGI